MKSFSCFHSLLNKLLNVLEITDKGIIYGLIHYINFILSNQPCFIRMNIAIKIFLQLR